jgi:recombination protein RecA
MNDENMDILKDIHKEFGDESILAGINTGGVKNIPSISTRCLSLDVALGIGGVPRGRMTEIFGPESSGKTTLALTIIAECQSKGGRAAFIDAEHAIDADYTAAIGVDLEKLLFSQPDSGEQALKICEALLDTNKVDIIVIDSVAGLVPQSELEGEIGDANVGAQARLMSQACRKLARKVCKTNTALVFINQIREKIGVMGFGPKTDTPGGRALKFWSSVRLDIRSIGKVKQSEEIVANKTLVKVVKNKVAPPFKSADFEIVFGKGISYVGDIISLALKANVLTKNGNFIKYGDNSLGNGLSQATENLKKDKKALDEIVEIMKSKLLPKHIKETENNNEQNSEEARST